MNKLSFCYTVLLFLFFMNLAPVAASDLNVFQSSRAAGMGGAISAFPQGSETLLYNPAGISVPLNKKGKVNVTMSGVTFFQPKYLFAVFEGASASKVDYGTVLINAKNLITSSGAGGALSLCCTYTGKNWGYGILSSADVFLNGKPFPLGTKGWGKVDFAVPVAYSFNLVQNEVFDVAFGFELRPYCSFYTVLDGSDIDALIGGTSTLSDIFSQTVAHPYFSMPVDTGVIFAFHNIPWNKGQLRFSAVAQNLFGDLFVPGYNVFPLEKDIAVQLGCGLYMPVNLKFFDFYSLVSLEVKEFNSVVSGSSSFWKALAVGLELGISSFLNVQFGLSSGYPCTALQLSILGFSLGCSWQTTETGLYIGDNPLSQFRITIGACF